MPFRNTYESSSLGFYKDQVGTSAIMRPITVQSFAIMGQHPSLLTTSSSRGSKITSNSSLCMDIFNQFFSQCLSHRLVQQLLQFFMTTPMVMVGLLTPGLTQGTDYTQYVLPL